MPQKGSKGIKIIWTFYIVFIILVPIYIYSVKTNLNGWFGEQPSIYDLQNPKNSFASELYSADGVLLGKYYRYNRSSVFFSELPESIINALLATEDCRFFAHHGIDIKGILRAIFLSVLLGKKKGGGSTITQQLAKNLFQLRTIKQTGFLCKLPLIGMIITKTKEWLVAIELERTYTKKEIIEFYFTTSTFGHNTYGIKVAAKIFFNKDLKELSVNESAILIGILKAPSYYSPIKHPQRALLRRNIVLNQMYKYHYISEEESVIESAKDIKLNLVNEEHDIGIGTYFRALAREFIMSWAKKKGYDIFEDGLKIYTTIDSKMQIHAEQAVAHHLKILQEQFYNCWKAETPWRDENGEEIPDFIQKAIYRSSICKEWLKQNQNDTNQINQFLNTAIPTEIFAWAGDKNVLISPIEKLMHDKKILHAGLIAIAPLSGAVKAWVGGINYKHFKYDHVMQGARQPGSLFKPIVYAAAIDSGYLPWDVATDAPVTFRLSADKTWTPQNWSKEFSYKSMTLREAMVRSLNSVVAYLTMQIGPKTVADYAQRLGISVPLQQYPSICLGSQEVALLDITSVYGTFMNKGIWIKPTFITRIEDRYGNILEIFMPETKEAISESSAYLMIHMLKASFEEKYGILYNLPEALKIDNELAGKTGTSQNQSDGWFVGLSHNLCVGVWVGADDRCVHFPTLGQGSGFRMAKPIWEKFLTSLYEDCSINYSKGLLLPENIPAPLKMYSQYFIKNKRE